VIFGKKISLRQVRTIDIPSIMIWENNPENWLVSETVKAYTFGEVILLVDSSEDIFENGQLRFIISNNHLNTPIGTLDLFQTNFEEKSVHIGILITDSNNRRKGFAQESISLVQNYITSDLDFNFLYCTIQCFNQSSFELFKKCGFEVIEDGKENPIFDSNSLESIKMCLCLKK
jgi:diamine N-acetyltransferase